jgi:alkylation response protein AidB-like acyl-CoA dehydrogenase
VAAVTALHAEIDGAILPAGPAGHVFLPEHLVRRCDGYGTPSGPEVRAGAAERRLGEVAVGPDTMVALHIPGAGPGGGDSGPDTWSVGLGWLRLGLADRFLAQAVEHLRGRKVQDTVTLNLPPVRVLLADAAASIAEADALLAAGPDFAALHRAHRALDEAGRVCLHLFGATGFLADGPGSEVRAAELLGDTYTNRGGPQSTVEEE